MSSDRKEPTISITPERDEIASHQQQQQQGSRNANAARSKSNHGSRSVPAAVKPSRLAPFALLLALTGLGLAGFVYWQMLGLQQTLVKADARILDLEGRLELSDDESSQSVTAIRVKLKWADSEIRKLWGVSNDRNRKAIAAQKQRLNTLDKSVKSTVANTKKVLASAANQASALADVQSQSSAQQKMLERITSDMSTQKQQLQSVVDLGNRVDQQLNRLQTDMRRRVKANEEAIEAIDAYRRNINRDLLQLKQQLQGSGA